MHQLAAAMATKTTQIGAPPLAAAAIPDGQNQTLTYTHYFLFLFTFSHFSLHLGV